MPKEDYTTVVCLEVPTVKSSDSVVYNKGAEYQAKKNSPTGPWWVGLHRKGGHHFNDDDFKKHFKVKP